MRFKKWIGVLAVTVVVCGRMAFAYFEVDRSEQKSASTQAPPAPVEFITPEELKTKIAKNEPVLVVDLRGMSSYEQSNQIIKGSLFTKVRRVAHRLKDIPRDREIVP